MTNSEQSYDLIVIGAGSGGVRASRIAAGHGAKVALIEKGYLGGTCVNVGCVPKKLMAYAGEYCHCIEDAEGYGWAVDKPVHSWKNLIQNKDKEISRLRSIYDNLLKDVDIYRGRGSFIDPYTIQVEQDDSKNITLTGKRILIATGGTPRIPDIPGNEFFSSSDDMFYLDECPEHITIYGGGYIAAEFASIMRGLGAQVSIVYRGSMFLRHFDDDIRLHLMDELRKQDIDLHFHCEIKSISKHKNGRLTVKTTHHGDHQTDLVLAATGRIANIKDLHLNQCDINVEGNGLIKVNDEYQTQHPHIYAVGDIISDIQLTPVAIAEAHYLVDKLYADADKPKHPKPNYCNIPTAVFTNPPVGTVGLTEKQAISEYGEDDLVCYISRFRAMKYTLPNRHTQSLLKLIVHKNTNKVIGLHMCGHDAPEIVQGFGLAIEVGATKHDFDRMIGIHPTSGEEFFTMRTPSVQKTGRAKISTRDKLEKDAKCG